MNCISFQKEKKYNEIILQNWCQRIKRPISLIPNCYLNKLKKSADTVTPFFPVQFQNAR